jgi:prepilin-type N-terminal cleavage/methylation domain-containing protein
MLGRARGFTIIEIVTALVILGLLVGIATPRMVEQVNRIRIRSTLDQLTSTIYRTRVIAVRNSARLKIRLQPNHGCAEAYIVETAEGVRIDSVALNGGASRVCVSSNVPQSMTINSRGMLIGSPRMLYGRAGTQTDSISVSIVGRVYRWY